ncbi:hypothetical protein ACJMK2_017872 [Sinanodonta woodiana]|uniref:Uncharacterized protein n=1 Tax=Sinanodonta woodiana TaxID=1069815 RepID=A0ABD3UDQ6_SINWO
MWKRLLQPALRFHGISGNLWTQPGTSTSPPSVKSELGSFNSRGQNIDCLSLPRYTDICAGDQISMHNTTTMSVISTDHNRVRRRNTLALIFVAIAFMAAIAIIVGLALFFSQPPDMLRANVRLVIANRNFTDEMLNSSSIDWFSIEKPLCAEMDIYYLSSEMGSYYLGCKLRSLRSSDDPFGLGVHITLDFEETKATKNPERIKEIIMLKSGRHTADKKLYLVIRKFLVYLRSLTVDTEKLPMPDKIPRPKFPIDDSKSTSFSIDVPTSLYTNDGSIKQSHVLTDYIIDSSYSSSSTASLYLTSAYIKLSTALFIDNTIQHSIILLNKITPDVSRLPLLTHTSFVNILSSSQLDHAGEIPFLFSHSGTVYTAVSDKFWFPQKHGDIRKEFIPRFFNTEAIRSSTFVFPIIPSSSLDSTISVTTTINIAANTRSAYLLKPDRIRSSLQELIVTQNPAIYNSPLLFSATVFRGLSMGDNPILDVKDQTSEKLLASAIFSYLTMTSSVAGGSMEIWPSLSPTFIGLNSINLSHSSRSTGIDFQNSTVPLMPNISHIAVKGSNNIKYGSSNIASLSDITIHTSMFPEGTIDILPSSAGLSIQNHISRTFLYANKNNTTMKYSTVNELDVTPRSSKILLLFSDVQLKYFIKGEDGINSRPIQMSSVHVKQSDSVNKDSMTSTILISTNHLQVKSSDLFKSNHKTYQSHTSMHAEFENIFSSRTSTSQLISSVERRDFIPYGETLVRSDISSRNFSVPDTSSHKEVKDTESPDNKKIRKLKSDIFLIFGATVHDEDIKFTLQPSFALSSIEVSETKFNKALLLSANSMDVETVYSTFIETGSDTPSSTPIFATSTSMGTVTARTRIMEMQLSPVYTTKVPLLFKEPTRSSVYKTVSYSTPMHIFSSTSSDVFRNQLPQQGFVETKVKPIPTKYLPFNVETSDTSVQVLVSLTTLTESPAEHIFPEVAVPASNQLQRPITVGQTTSPKVITIEEAGNVTEGIPALREIQNRDSQDLLDVRRITGSNRLPSWDIFAIPMGLLTKASLLLPKIDVIKTKELIINSYLDKIISGITTRSINRDHDYTSTDTAPPNVRVIETKNDVSLAKTRNADVDADGGLGPELGVRSRAIGAPNHFEMTLNAFEIQSVRHRGTLVPVAGWKKPVEKIHQIDNEKENVNMKSGNVIPSWSDNVPQPELKNVNIVMPIVPMLPVDSQVFFKNTFPIGSTRVQMGTLGERKMLPTNQLPLQSQNNRPSKAVINDIASGFETVKVAQHVSQNSPNAFIDPSAQPSMITIRMDPRLQNILIPGFHATVNKAENTNMLHIRDQPIYPTGVNRNSNTFKLTQIGVRHPSPQTDTVHVNKLHWPSQQQPNSGFPNLYNISRWYNPTMAVYQTTVDPMINQRWLYLTLKSNTSPHIFQYPMARSSMNYQYRYPIQQPWQKPTNIIHPNYINTFGYGTVTGDVDRYLLKSPKKSYDNPNEKVHVPPNGVYFNYKSRSNKRMVSTFKPIPYSHVTPETSYTYLNVRLKGIISPHLLFGYGRPLHDGFWKSRPIDTWLIDTAHKPLDFDTINTIKKMKDTADELYHEIFSLNGKLNNLHGTLKDLNDILNVKNQTIDRLMEALRNMSESLVNLKTNFVSINATLADFKMFMKGLNNSVFNMDDTIDNMDSTLRNLEKAFQIINGTIFHMNDSVFGMNGTLVDVRGSLKDMNNTLAEINDMVLYSNKTLESMNKTVGSMDSNINDLSIKIDKVNGSLSGINVSLLNIFDTAKRSQERLFGVDERLKKMAQSLSKMNSTTDKLNIKFHDISTALKSMNETFSNFTGTSLAVIERLFNIDDSIVNMNNTVDTMNTSVGGMNESLAQTFKWLKNMTYILERLNGTLYDANGTITINLKDETVFYMLNELLHVNGTLNEMENGLTNVNEKLDLMDNQVGKLFDVFRGLEEALDLINNTFTTLNQTIIQMNLTLHDIKETLQKVNGTVQNVNKTLTEMNVAVKMAKQNMGDANEALSPMDSNLDEIDTKIDSINKTIDNIKNVMVSSNRTLLVLDNNIDALNGSLANMLTTIMTSNETFSVVKSKSSIMKDSLKLVNTAVKSLMDKMSNFYQTLLNVNNTVTETAENLNEVSVTKPSVNETLLNVNGTLMNLQHHFDEIESQFKQFEDAFPHLRELMSDVQLDISHLKTDVQNKSDCLSNLNEKELGAKDLLSHVHKMYDTTFQKWDRINRKLSNIGLYGNNISDPVNNVLDEVDRIQRKLDETGEKLLYLNGTIPAIQEQNKYISDKSQRTMDTINNLKRNLESLQTMVPSLLDSLDSVSNVNVSLKEILNDIRVYKMTLLDMESSLNGDMKDVASTNALLWDQNYNPISIKDSLPDFKLKVNKSSTLLNNLRTNVDGFDRNIADMNESITQIHNKFDNLTNILKTNQRIRKDMETVSNSSEILQEMLKESFKNFTDLLKKLDSLKNATDYIKQYSNINGTFNASSMYKSIDAKLAVTDTSISDLHQKLMTLNATFLKTKDWYSSATAEFRNSSLDLSNGMFILNNMEMAVGNASISFDEQQSTLNDIVKYIVNVNTMVTSLTKETEKANNTLNVKQNKYNYKNNNLPSLKEKFDAVKDFISKTKKVLNEAKLTNIHATFNVDALQEKIDEFANVNASTKDMQNMLANNNATFIVEETELTERIVDFDSLQGHFNMTDDSNMTLDELKEIYSSVNATLDGFLSTLNHSHFRLSSAVKGIDALNERVYNLSASLDRYNNTDVKMSHLGERIQQAENVYDDTSLKLSTAMEHLENLHKSLMNIRNEYQNVTEDIVERVNTFINESMKDVNNTLLGLNETMKALYMQLINVKENFTKGDGILRNSTYTEENFNSTLDDVDSVYVPVNESIDSLLKQIEDVNLRITTTDIDIERINYTVHNTNETLFIQRQKMHYVNKTFPRFLTHTQSLNRTRLDIHQKLTDVSRKVELLRNLHSNLIDQISNITNLNVSLKSEESEAFEMTEKLENISKLLHKVENVQNNINNSLLFINGETYSNQESLEQIKERFQILNQTLNNIDSDLSAMNRELDTISDSADTVLEEFGHLNTSLFAYKKTWKDIDNTHTSLQDLTSSVTPLSENLITLHGRGKELNVTFMDINERFSGINQSIFDSLSIPFNTSLRNFTLSLDQTKEALQQTINSLQNVSERTSNTKDLIESIISSRDELENVTQTADQFINITKDFIEKEKINADGHKAVTERLKLDMQHLLENLSKMIETFKKQEVIDFVTSNLQDLVKKYNDINNTFPNLRAYIDDIQGKHMGVTEDLSLLTKRLEDFPLINISLFNLTESVSHTHTDLNIVNGLYGGIRKVFDGLEYPFLKGNTYLFTDNETIDEVREKFNNVNNTMLSIEETARQMERTLGEDTSNLGRTETAINVLNDIVDNYTKLEKDITELGTNLKDTKRNLTLIGNHRTQLADELFQIYDSFNRLNSQYQTLNTTAINNLKSNINNIVKNVQNVLNFSGESINSLLNTSNGIYDYFEQELKTSFYDNFTELNDLEETLRNISTMTTILKDNNTFVHKSAEKWRKDLESVPANITNLRDLLQQLDEHFKEKEKFDYVSRHVQEIKEKYQLANNSYMLALEENRKVEENLSDTSNTFDDLVTRLEIYPEVNIPVTKLRDVLKTEEMSLIKVNESLAEARSMYNTLNETFLQGEDYQHRPEETIEQIIDKFQRLNKTLDSALESISTDIMSLHESDGRIKEAIAIIKDTNTTLDEYRDLVSDMDQLRTKIGEKKENKNDFNQSFTMLQDTVADLHSEFQGLVGDYSRVNSTSISKKRNDIEHIFKEILTKQLEIEERNASLFDRLIEIDGDFKSTNTQLNGSISNISHLKSIIINATNQTLSLNKDLIDFSLNLTSASNLVNETNSLASQVKDLLRELRDMYIQREKVDYVDETLPILRKKFIDANRSLDYTSTRKRQFNDTINNATSALYNLVDRMATILNMNISLSKEKEEISNNKEMFSLLLESVHDTKRQYTERNESYLAGSEYVHNLNETVAEIVEKFALINKTLDNIITTADRLQSTIDAKDNSLKEIIQTISNIDLSLDTFSVESRRIDEITKKMNDTSEILSIIRNQTNSTISKFDDLKDGFDNMKSRFRYVNSSDIQAKRSRVETIITFLEHLKHKINTNVSDLETTFNQTNGQFRSSADKLNGIISDRGELSILLSNISRVSDQTNHSVIEILETKVHTQNDIENMTDAVNLMDIYIHELHAMYIEKEKDDYINQTLPSVKTWYGNLSNAILNSENDLQTAVDTLLRLRNKFEAIDAKLLKEPSINILLDDMNSTIHTFRTILKDAETSLQDARKEMETINGTLWSENGTFINKSDTIDMITERIRQFRANLATINGMLNSAANNISGIEDSVADIDGTLSVIDKLLDKYNITSVNIGTMQDDIDYFRLSIQQKEETMSKLKIKLDEYNQSLSSMRQKYSNVSEIMLDNNNASYLDIRISNISSIVQYIDNVTGNLSRTIASIEQAFVDLNSTFRTTVNSSEQMRDLLNRVDMDYVHLKSRLKYWNISFDDLSEDVYALNKTLTSMDKDLIELNQTLHREHEKFSYSEDALPTIKEKHQLESENLSKANNSLHVITRSLSHLDGRIRELDSRLNQYPTINISLSEMRDNVATMNETLNNLQDQYKNISSILDILQDNITATEKRVFGENMSLSILQKIYTELGYAVDNASNAVNNMVKSFSELNAVISKVHQSMDKINRTLDEFDILNHNITRQKEEIVDVKENKNITGSWLEMLMLDVSSLNNTYRKLQDTFLDVREAGIRTDEPLLEQKIKEVEQTLYTLSENVKDKANSFDKAESDFEPMNSTLFNMTSDLDQLRGTLVTVTNTHRTISNTLNDVSVALNMTNVEAKTMNDTLDKLKASVTELEENLKHEQQKVRLVNRTLPEMVESYSQVGTFLNSTEDTLTSVINQLEDLSTQLNATKKRMQTFNTMEIPLTNVSLDLDEMDASSKLLLTQLKDMKNTHDSLQSDMVLLPLLNGTLAEIQDKYYKFNETLIKLKKDLRVMNTTFSSMTSIISTHRDMLDDVDKDLTELSILQKRMDNLNTSLHNVSTAITNDKTLLQVISNNASHLDEAIRIMKETYQDLNHTFLAENGTVSKIVDSLISLNASLDETNHRLNTLNDTETDALKRYENLNRTLYNSTKTAEDLKTLLKAADMEETAIESQVQSVASGLKDVHINTTEMWDDVLKLDELLSNLNDTLFHEQNKLHYIQENRPKMTAKHEKTNESIAWTERYVRDAEEDVNTLNDRLEKLTEMMNQLPTININLTSEMEQIRNMNKTVANVFVQYENVSDNFNALNVSDLQDRIGSISEVQYRYITFNNTLDETRSSLENIQANVSTIGDKTSLLDSYFNDINSTLGSFMDTANKTNNLGSKMEDVSKHLKVVTGGVDSLQPRVDTAQSALDTMILKYQHINSSYLQSMIKDVEQKMKRVQNTTKSSKDVSDNILKSFSIAETDYGSIVKKLYGNTTSLDKLRDVIRDVDGREENLRDTIYHINKTLEHLVAEQPVIASAFSDLERSLTLLNETLLKEQEKLDYINNSLPVSKEHYRTLNKSFESTGMHIQTLDHKLAVVEDKLQQVKNRLKNYSTLNISTELMDKDLKYMSNLTDNMHKNFTDMKLRYAELKLSVEQLSDVNVSIEEIQKRFNNVNRILAVFDEELKTMDQTVKGMNESVQEIDNNIKKINSTMDTFTETEKKIQSLGNSSTEAGGKITKVEKDVINLSNKLKGLTNTLNDLNSTYGDMKDPVLLQGGAEIRETLKVAGLNINHANRTLYSIWSAFDGVNKTFTRMKNTISNQTLNIHNADTVLLGLNKDHAAADTNLQNVIKSITATDKNSTTISKPLADISKQLANMTMELVKERSKRDYVNSTLPKLQNRYSNINDSHAKSNSTIEDIKQKTESVKSIVSKIRRKIQDFGIDKPDKQFTDIEMSVNAMEKTLEAILKKYAVNNKQLDDLKLKLYGSGPQYNRSEQVTDVMDRFEFYNKTMDGIDTLVQDIVSSLKDMDENSKLYSGTLNQMDSAMTTTQATTTPSGPPDWLTLTSTGGFIGEGSGSVICSAATDDWKVMTIQKTSPTETTRLAMLSIIHGARKTVNDKDLRKRVDVRKQVNGTEKSLNMKIDKLECQDEGIYLCDVDTYSMWPIRTNLIIKSKPKDNLKTVFPTEVFENKIATFSCEGTPGYPQGQLKWSIKKKSDKDFQEYNFYSAKFNHTDEKCVRKSFSEVEYMFDMTWNETLIRCETTDSEYFSEGIIRLLPAAICRGKRINDAIPHPYTMTKYIFCGKELSIQSCPAGTCFDSKTKECGWCPEEPNPCQNKGAFVQVPHPTDCRKYYLCLGHTRELKTCRTGYFDPNSTESNKCTETAKSRCTT